MRTAFTTAAAALVLAAGVVIATDSECPPGAIDVHNGQPCCVPHIKRAFTPRRGLLTRTTSTCCTEKEPSSPTVSKKVNLQCGRNYGDDSKDVEDGVEFDVVECPTGYGTGDCFHVKITVAAGAVIGDMHLQINDDPITVNTGLGNAPWIDKVYCDGLLGECWVPLDYIQNLFPTDSLCGKAVNVAAGVGINGATCFQEGTRISPTGNWFSYTTVTFECSDDICAKSCDCPTGKWCNMGTAYGYAEDKAITFNPTLVGAGATGCRKWGWYYKISSADLYGAGLTGDLRVGAGGNDVSKSIDVGDFSAKLSGTTLTVKYDLTSGYDLGEVHVYASCNAPTSCAPGSWAAYNSHNSGLDLSSTTDRIFEQAITVPKCDTYYLIFHGAINNKIHDHTCQIPIE
ncbi:hypothetical protein DL764_001836 [Monosporascus ibericus]|uniref:Uncharacterized protein n=1 Tax=Monosporascus ibericus TaxID=155417 RepID=A0A4Q4TN14_9PEZI|nr:hypothetical protein DL764_001836 [Monosporascus ibericus]